MRAALDGQAESVLRYITNQSVSNQTVPATSPSAAPKRERRKQARPGELLEAALDLFVEKGYAATRVEEVAARAGVSKGTLFLYFPSKEDLFKAVVRHNIVGRFVQWGEQLQQYTGSTADMLRTCCLAWWDGVGNTPASGLAKLMMSEAGNFPNLAVFYQTEVIAPAQALIRLVLERGVASGEFRPALQVDYAVHSVISPLLFLMLAKHSGGVCGAQSQNFDPVRFIEHQLDCLLYGLCQQGKP